MFELEGMKHVWEYIATTILALWLGSAEYRMRKLQDIQSKSPSREEMDKSIDLHQRVVKAIQSEIKEDINRLDNKLDKLTELLTKKD